jgi:SAM-dependent methyltransferase
MAAGVSARWPDTLSFHVRCGNEWVSVETKLFGEHLLPSTLGALATAMSCGVPLEEAVAVLKDVAAVEGRMQPVRLPSGAHIICDSYNATLPTLQAGLDFLASSRARRRIAVVGDALDAGLGPSLRLQDLGRRVAAAADVALFVGHKSAAAPKAAIQSGLPPGQAVAFKTLQQAAAFLRTELRDGDLAFIKGWSGRHMERLSIAQSGNIACWLSKCSKRIACSSCPDLKFTPFATSLETESQLIPGESRPSWYLDRCAAIQKRTVHQRWIRRSVGNHRHDVVLKTDLFEEAYGEDALLDDLLPHMRLTIATDINPKTVLTAARPRKAHLRAVVGDVRKLPIASGSVDVVVSTSTLDHFATRNEVAQSLTELARIVRPDGMLLITLDNPWNPLYPILRWTSRRGWTPFTLGVTVSSATLRRMLIERGFKIVGTEYLIHNPRGVSTLLFLAIRRVFRDRAEWLIQVLLQGFALLDRLPSRRVTACFLAVSAIKVASGTDRPGE